MSDLSFQKQYLDFLANKQLLFAPTGFDVTTEQLSTILFPFQRDIVRWALKRGKAATFASTGLGKCVVGETLVNTQHGLIEIEKLKPESSGEKESELRIIVQTPDGKMETSHFYDSGINQTLKIKTHMGFELAGTLHHPVLVLSKNGHKEWRKLQDIRVGDYVAIQRHESLFGENVDLPKSKYIRPGIYTIEQRKKAVHIMQKNKGVLSKNTLALIRTVLNNNVTSDSIRAWNRKGIHGPGNAKMPNFPEKLDPETAYVIGAITGDGSLRRKSTVLFTNPDKEIVEYVRSWATSIGIELLKKDDINFQMHSKALVLWLNAIGIDSVLAHEKDVPPIIMQSTKENVRAYLQGLFDTDGSSLKEGWIEYCTTSKKLAHKIHTMILLFGIISRLRFKPNNKKGAWIIQIYGKEARNFYEQIGFRLTRKQERMKFLPKKTNTNIDVIPYLPKTTTIRNRKWGVYHKSFIVWLNGQRKPSYDKLSEIAREYTEFQYLLQPKFFWDRVDEVTDNGMTHTYDLSVPNAHSFIANGIVSHNTSIELEFSDAVHRHTGGNVLIVAPLSVSEQTVRESARLFGRTIALCKTQDDVQRGVNITNYERLDCFDASVFDGVVLDESGILKNHSGSTRNMIINKFQHTPFKLAATATPAPNDFMELGNHAEFLGAMSRSEMLSMFFVHDGGETSKWRLKGHAEDAFWEWVASWAVMLRSPEDLGYDGSMFELPPLVIEDVVVKAQNMGDSLFFTEALTLQERQRARRETIVERIQAAVDTAQTAPDEKWLIWCDLNDEQDALERAFGDRCVSIRGATPPDKKLEMERQWREGDIPIFVSKPSIFGYGMNWQHCHREVFVGLNDSFESVFQAIRRCYRFGQTESVKVFMITSDREGAVAKNIKRKEADFEHMMQNMLKHTSKIMAEHVHALTKTETTYEPKAPIQIAPWLIASSLEEEGEAI